MAHNEAKGYAEQPELANRDFDMERSAAALTFDVPTEKLDPRCPETTDRGILADVTPGLRALLLSALCNLATARFDKTVDCK